MIFFIFCEKTFLYPKCEKKGGKIFTKYFIFDKITPLRCILLKYNLISSGNIHRYPKIKDSNRRFRFYTISRISTEILYIFSLNFEVLKNMFDWIFLILYWIFYVSSKCSKYWLPSYETKILETFKHAQLEMYVT